MIPFLEFSKVDPTVNKLIAKYSNAFGLFKLGFNISAHVLWDRLNHPRNKPAITVEELDSILSNFIRKKKAQLIDDSNAVSVGMVVPRGKNTNRIRPGNFEYVLISKKTKVVIVLSVQPNSRGHMLARVNIITVMRKAGFQVSQGETVLLESLDLGADYEIVILD